MNQRKDAIEKVEKEAGLVSNIENYVEVVKQIINDLCDDFKKKEY